MNNHSMLNSVGIGCLAGYTKLKLDDIEKKIESLQKGVALPSFSNPLKTLTPQPLNTVSSSSMLDIPVKKLQKENNIIASILINMKETNDRLLEDVNMLKKKIKILESGSSGLGAPTMINEEQECDENDYLQLLSQFEEAEEADAVKADAPVSVV